MIVSAGKAPNPPGAGYDMSGGEATEYCPPLLQSDKLLQLSSDTTPVSRPGGEEVRGPPAGE